MIGKDMLNLNTLASLAPVAGGLYVMTHFGSIVGGLAAITVGAAVIKHGQGKAKAEREDKAIEERKAALAEQAQVYLAAEREAIAPAQERDWSQPKRMVIDHTGTAVERHG